MKPPFGSRVFRCAMNSSEEVLSDITMALAAGTFTFLTGASGAGKTSLLKLIYLGLSPTQGHVSLFGRRTAELDRRALAAIRRRDRHGVSGISPARSLVGL